MRVCLRRVPRCYARVTMSDDSEQARIDTQCTGALIMLSVISVAVVFLVAHGGWGFDQRPEFPKPAK